MDAVVDHDMVGALFHFFLIHLFGYPFEGLFAAYSIALHDSGYACLNGGDNSDDYVGIAVETSVVEYGGLHPGIVALEEIFCNSRMHDCIDSLDIVVALHHE